MKPDFALTLSYEGIRLLHRDASGWTQVGEAPLDSPDLGAALGALRRAGSARGGADLRVKIVLPNDQIRYVALDNPRATRAEVEAVLDGATPYAVADLVFDYRSGGGRTWIAAVARETLDEAESFAADHRFGPVCFVAIPEPYTFPGEPFFGPTRIAAALLPPGEVPERDAGPVTLPRKGPKLTLTTARGAVLQKPAEAPPPPAAEVAPEPAASADTAQSASPEPPPPPAEAPPADPPVTPVPATVAADTTPPAGAAETAAPPLSEDAAAASPAPLDLSMPPVAATAEVAAPEAAPEAEPPAAAEPVAEPAPPAAPDEGEAPVFASRSRTLRTEEAAPPTPPPTLSPVAAEGPSEATDPAPEVMFARRVDVRRDPPPLRPPVAPDDSDAPQPVLRPLAVATGTPPAPPLAAPAARPAGDTAAVPSVAAPTVAAPPVTGAAAAVPGPAAAPAGGAPRIGGVAAAVTEPPAARRKAPATPAAPAPAGPARGRSLDDIDADIPPLPGEATVAAAAARKAAPFAAKPARPRKGRLRLALVLTGLLLLAMAAVALWATTLESGLAGLFGRDAQPAAATADAAPAIASDPVVTALPAVEGTAPVILPARDGAPVAATAPTLAAPAAAPDALAGPAPEPAVAALPEPDPAPAAEDTGTVISAEEAERIYAATGVWLRAPRLPLLPRTETLDDLQTAAADQPLRADAALTLPAGVAPDAGLPPQPLPPPPGTVFDRDERGIIRALPDGVLLPNGAVVFAGRPALIPPTRPGTVAPPPPPPAEVAAAALAAAPGLRPPARPETVLAAAAAALPAAAPPPAEIAEAADAPPVNPGGIALNGLRPAARPAGIAPEPAPLWEGPRPGLRPDGIAPPPPEAPAPEPAADPAPPAEPDLNTTLAAIVANAPDPLAGVTAQAVPQARRPDARPRNFDRVVARQNERLARAQEAATAPGGIGTDALAGGAVESDEPDPASEIALAPSGESPVGVAEAATLTRAINLREINLIGVFGSESDRRALVRLANGRMVRVGVGDSLDGGQVVAIGGDSLNYTRRGRTVTLEVPGG